MKNLLKSNILIGVIQNLDFVFDFVRTAHPTFQYVGKNMVGCGE
ncbi:MAG: hypothetical protein Q9M22_01515 [Mariprofundaceae bacterium]|nr:hypothetical protein [Mariprofundaceae bacterium]